MMISGSLGTKWRQIGGVPPCLPVPSACYDAGDFDRVSVASQAALRYQLAAANYRY